jgi:hypothetical protein
VLLTEWGVNNPSQACPLDDQTRVAAQAQRKAYAQYVEQERLTAVLYYFLERRCPPPRATPSKTENPGAVFR